MEKLIFSLAIVLLSFPNIANSQDNTNWEVRYEVNVNYPPLSISKEKLQEAESLIDLNSRYPSSWMKEYISVEVSAMYNGEEKKAMSENDILSQEQKDLMKLADVGTDISVTINYLPENNLKENESKDFNFSFIVDPDSNAEFPGGKEKLKQYIAANAQSKISETVFREHQLSGVKFTVDEEGYVTDAHVFWSTDDEKADKILLETICNMPQWKPAEYANGTKVKQEFAFAVGDMKSCVRNFINFREEDL